jgi:hypothetical protein
VEPSDSLATILLEIPKKSPIHGEGYAKDFWASFAEGRGDPPHTACGSYEASGYKYLKLNFGVSVRRVW